MIDEIQNLIDSYISWLKDKTTLKQLDKDWVEITTPHLDRHNDCLQIYARRQNGGFLLSDGGYIITDLLQSGCKLDSPKRKELLKMTLAGFGVENNKETLEVLASEHNFALKKHNLIQAMLAINDLFYTASPMVSSLFYEDVVEWLDFQGIRYTPKVKFTGKSGYDHQFDFVIPKSRKQPERIIQTINRPNRDTAETTAFRWLDTKEVRSSNSRAYALINDQEKVPQSVSEALRNYNVEPILWSDREKYLLDLAA